MFWNKKEKILNLAIGNISESTIKNNFSMIEREYNELIRPMNEKINSLNKDLVLTIHKEIHTYVWHLKDIYRVIDEDDSNRKHYERMLELTEVGKKERDRLIKELNLPKVLLDETTLIQSINKIQEEFNLLENKYSDNLYY